MEPKFPITVTFHEDGDVWVLDNINELGTNLEWFNSTNPDERASVRDASNKDVTLVVEKLKVKECRLS